MATRRMMLVHGFGTLVSVVGFLTLIAAAVNVAAGNATAGVSQGVLGVLVIFVAFLSRRRYLCSACGNRLEPTSKICPACHAQIDH